MSEVDFREEDHSYRIDGKDVPSVSKILEALYDFRFVKDADLKAASDRGKKVHKTIELAEQGRLNEATLHPFLAAHLDSWRTFCADFKFTPKHHEVVVHSKKYGLAGTYDVDGEMEDDGTWLIDIKTGLVYPAHKLQTAAYKKMAVDGGVLPPETKRASVYLFEDGYDVKFHTNPIDEAAFLSLLTVHHWKAHHGK